MTFAISLYNVALFVHIAAVVVAFGVTFTYPAFYAVAAQSDWQQRVRIHTLQQRIGRTYLSFGLLVVVLAGAYLASDRGLWREPWVAGPFVIAVIIGGIGGGYLAPRETRLAELADSGGEAEYAKALGEAKFASYFLSFLVIVAIFLMTTKPG